MGRVPTEDISAAVGPDCVIATYGLVDSVYVYDLDGRKTESLGIESEHFRPYVDPEQWPPPPEWLTSFSMVEEGFALPDGSILLEYVDRQDSGPVRGLVGISANRTVLFDLIGTPDLLSVDVGTGQLIFQSPDALAPNVWRVAQWRTHSP